jgi:sigma-B regulation protein RsbU (phosphoserine phosphatase)
MKILIAEDESVSRRMLEATVSKWGYEVSLACDGNEAWAQLQQPASPPLLILDWQMPGIDGIDLCRRIREHKGLSSLYVILLTSRDTKKDLIHGLEAGADDYVTKPFDPEELRARLHVGTRVIGLQHALAERVEELEAALFREKQLQGLLPICCYCKKIRDDSNYWHQVEAYMAQHAQVQFSHSVCPECTEKFKKDMGLA